MRVFEDFEWRGLVQNATEGARAALDGPPIRAYVGFDPTAPSLHVGSLMPLLALARLQRAGHRAVALVGGGTGLIGDPSGKTAERQLLTREQVAHNVERLKAQIGRFVRFEGENAAALIDNAEWLCSIGLTDFLRDVGKHFTVNYMMGKESVKRRLESETGISFTEFSYLILQAHDFEELFARHGVTMQLGGSDQWGNITAGIDLIRAKHGKPAHGLTWPLVTNSTGVKFGKTEAGAVWLDAAQTSPYRFFQFFVNADDRDVVRYLKYFTFLPREEIEALEQRHAAAPHERAAHTRLAEELTRMVHGEEGLARARRATQVFFGGDFADLVAAEVLEIFADVPSCTVERGRFEGGRLGVVDALLLAKVAPSKGEAKRAIEGGGIYVNNQKVGDASFELDLARAIGGELFVLRKGKKAYTALRIGGA